MADAAITAEGLGKRCLGGPTTRPARQATAWLIGLLAITIPAAITSYRHAASA